MKNETFKIEAGCRKITVDFESHTVTHEYEGWTPKIGEVVKMPFGSMFIFKRNEALGQVGFGDLCFRDGKVFKSTCKAMTLESMPTTHADRCIFFEALNKAGYKWNAKKLELTKKEVYTPKIGDFVTCEKNEFGNKWLIIWGEKPGNYTHEKFSYSPTKKRESNYCCCGIKDIFRPMTDLEKQQLLDALHAAGKDWDAEKMEVVELKWKPKKGERYYVPVIAKPLFYTEETFLDDSDDNRWLALGIVYRTKEEAIARAKQMLQPC